jgi:hypothetical protein
MSNSDWIPRKEIELVVLVQTWIKKLEDSTYVSLYGWPEEACMQLKDNMQTFLSMRTVYIASPTTENRIDRDEIKAIVIEGMRVFARENIRFSAVLSDSQKHEMGVTITDMEPSPGPIPSECPQGNAIANPGSPGVVCVRYPGAKPYGVDRLEIAFCISPIPITSPDYLTDHDTFSHNPWKHTFTGDFRGKRLYFSLRYLGKYAKSNWSKVGEVIIP